MKGIWSAIVALALLAGCAAHSSSLPRAGNAVIPFSITSPSPNPTATAIGSPTPAPSGTPSRWAMTYVGVGSNPVGMAVGSDGGMWFVEAGGNSVDRLDTFTKAIVRYPIPSPSSLPQSIAAGPDGALWFTEGSAHKIGRVDTLGNLTEYPVAGSGFLWQIVAGPNNSMWCSDFNGNIDSIAMDGTTNVYHIPSGNSPMQLTLGPDNAIWFTEPNGDHIGRVDGTGSFIEYPLPAGRKAPIGIVSLAGSMWFTESYANAIGNITTDGTVTEYPIPDTNPSLMMVGSGGWPWMTFGPMSRKIARFSLNNHTIKNLGWPPGVRAGTGIGMTGPDGHEYIPDSGSGAIVERL